MSADNDLEVTVLFVDSEDDIVITTDPVVVSVMVPEVELYVDDTTEVLVIALGNIGPPWSTRSRLDHWTRRTSQVLVVTALTLV
jgi:hypothetical protein